MDIRRFNCEEVVFADDNGGAAKAIKLTKQVPKQFKIATGSGIDKYLIIHHSDIGNLRKALDFVEAYWGETRV